MRKYQYYSTNDDGDFDGYSNNWLAQTFTVGTVHMISKVKLKLFRVGDPGTVIVSIKATSVGKPTGADLCSGTIEGLDITDNVNGEWYEITLGSGYLFEKNTMYAIVVRAPSGDGSNKVSWRADVGSSVFSGGTYCSSSDSGVDWGIISGSDCMFEEWGVGEPAPSVVVWGMLYKSQIDSEKIEEAIIRLLAVHNENETAHLGSGQSLQSHKASEIIDHIVSSIIADKIKDKEVIVSKLGWDRFFVMPEIESLDAWFKVEQGNLAAVILDTLGVCHLKAGDVAGNKTIMYIAHPLLELIVADDAFLQVGLDDDGGGELDIGAIIGDDDPFTNNHRVCGIKYIKDDNKTYAFYIDYYDAAFHEHKTEINNTPPYHERWRIEVDSANNKIYYYINETLLHTDTYNPAYFTFGVDKFFSIGCKNNWTGENFSVWVTTPIFAKKWN